MDVFRTSDAHWVIETKKMELQSVTLSDCKHHNTVEILVCVVPSSTITLLKVYTRTTTDKAVILQSSL